MKQVVRSKPKVGQVVYELDIKTKGIIPVIVKKVGHKYFSCGTEDCDYNIQYCIDTWNEDTRFSQSTRLYDSLKEYEDDVEYDIVLRYVRGVFGGFTTVGLSLEQLRGIKQIIEGDIR